MPRTAKPAVSAWIVRERKRLGLKPHDLAQRLTAMGLPVAEGTPRTWEAGRSPSADNIEGLERIFGSAAPSERPADDLAGLSALVAAISSLVEELRESRRTQADWEARIRALELAARLQAEQRVEGQREHSAPLATGE